MGFTIEASDGQIHWLITGRNWAGMALGAERISATCNTSVKLIPVNYNDCKNAETISIHSGASLSFLFGSVVNTFTALNVPDEEENWGWMIDLYAQYPIDVLSLSNIAAMDLYAGSVIQFSTIKRINNQRYRLHISDAVESGINNVCGEVKVVISGALNEAGYVFETMEYTFTPVNLIPDEIPLPEVLEVWNE